MTTPQGNPRETGTEKLQWKAPTEGQQSLYPFEIFSDPKMSTTGVHHHSISHKVQLFLNGLLFRE